MRKLGILAICVAASAGALLARGQATATSSGTLSVSPSSQNVGVAGSFTVKVMQTSGGSIQGVQTDLTFDPTKIQIDTVSLGSGYPGPGVSLTAGVSQTLPDAITEANSTGTLKNTAAFYDGDHGPATTSEALVIAMHAIGSVTCGVSPLNLGNQEMVDHAGDAITPVSITNGVMGIGTDEDCDGVLNASDNCAFVANAPQTNTDSKVILPHPGFAFDDSTAINSDASGDACDSDDDNDGLPDTTETALGPGHASHASCVTASADTDPLKSDTDGDLALDNVECSIGTDPASAASKPTIPQCVAASGAASTATDTDGDGVKDYVEFCYYDSNKSNANTDGDGCGDGREVASINADTVVTSGDLGAIASRFGPMTSGIYVADFDGNKDGSITSGDLGFVASKFGACP
jgi:hypothetical protein